ncbi:MAG: hypothetical protein LBF01_00910, partial [Bacteroidales bacterium]|nr:hypothetical protein [Bacteroidales bacterium]
NNGGNGNPPGGGGGGGRFEGGTGGKPGGAGANGKIILTFNYDINEDTNITNTPSIEGDTIRIVCKNGSITLSVDSPIIENYITYQWRKDGFDIVGATGSSHTIDNADFSDEGEYTVVRVVKYSFVGASSITGDNTDNGSKTLGGTSPESSSITLKLGPFYRVRITEEGPGKAWILNPNDPDDESIVHDSLSLCGTTVSPKVNSSVYGPVFHFVGYYKDTGNPDSLQFLSSDPDYTFISLEDIVIKALFDTNTYKVSFIPVREDGTPAPELGTTQNSGIYKHFHSVTGTATAEPHCRFLYWRDSVTKNYPIVPTVESLNGDITYEAVFEEITHTVTTAVDVQGNGVAIGDSVYSEFALTEQAQVEAIPSYGFTFQSWEVAVNGVPQGEIITDNPYIFIQNDHILNDYKFTAIFDTSVYNVTATVAHGSVSGTGNYLHGKTATLIATPDSGYHFVEWQVNGLQVSVDTTLHVQVVQDTSFTAIFEINTYPVTVSVSPAAYGEYASGADQSGSYAHFTVFNLEAVSYGGFEFRYWIVNGDTVSENAIHSITIDGAKTIEGIFTATRKKITVTAEPNEYGTTQGSGLYEHGSSVEAKAIPYYGFSFLYFKNSADNIIYDNPIIIPSLEHDTLFVAHFKRNNYTVEARAAVGGIVSLEALDSNLNIKQYPYENSVTVYAQSDSNHYFVNWTDRNGNVVSTQNPLSVIVEKDTFYKANFARKQYLISVSTVPENIAVTTGQGTFYVLDTAVLVATSILTAHFDGWSENGKDIFDTDDTLRVVVYANKNYYAMFSPIPFPLTVLSNDPERGTVQGSGHYYAGNNTRIMAQPFYGYDFKCWVRGGDTISAAKTAYPIIRAQDDTVTAIFVKHEFTVTVKDGDNIDSQKVPYRENTAISAM